MNHKEFSDFRKRLQKTQKELASLLGISLKAVCSYEQGWRSVPSHVERQLFFLLARKNRRTTQVDNCWEIKNCPEEKREQCPAWEFDSGQFCWFTSGTICENKAYKNWNEKFQVCKDCEILKSIG